MRKKSIIWSFFLATSILTASCATDTVATESNPTTLRIVKTPEMKNFENALFEWMRAKRQESATSSTARRSTSDIDNLMAQQAQTLLTHIGVTQTSATGRIQLSNQEIIHTALDAYASKLNDMYKELKKQ